MTNQTLPAITGGPRTLLRLEGLAAFAAAIAAFAHLGGGWGLFFALFLAPDLAFVGYLAGPTAGALAYNTTHSYVTAAAVAGIGLALGAPLLLLLACIQVAHIGMDRALGYGLKYATAASDTHLGPIGHKRARVSPPFSVAQHGA